jgi:hypothetical protein
MPIEPKQPTAKGPAERFTGEVYIDPVVRATDPSRVNISAVRFTPGARTAWHFHTVPAPAKSNRSAPATSSSHPPMSGTGTAQPPTTT